MEISKELLSEVLENEVVKFEIVSTKRITQIRIWYKNTKWHMYESWDIYHLAYKCKELAFKNHKIIINSRTTSKTKPINGYAEIIKNCDYLYGDYADTEIEAIFKACQWILDNK